MKKSILLEIRNGTPKESAERTLIMGGKGIVREPVKCAFSAQKTPRSVFLS